MNHFPNTMGSLMLRYCFGLFLFWIFQWNQIPTGAIWNSKTYLIKIEKLTELRIPNWYRKHRWLFQNNSIGIGHRASYCIVSHIIQIIIKLLLMIIIKFEWFVEKDGKWKYHFDEWMQTNDDEELPFYCPPTINFFNIFNIHSLKKFFEFIGNVIAVASLHNNNNLNSWIANYY